ncbi:MAG: glycoside hydrolase [Candidatus Acidiferrales bacterium]
MKCRQQIRALNSAIVFLAALGLLAFPSATCAQSSPAANANATNDAPIPASIYANLQWRCIGPFRGGRTVAGTGVPGNPNLFYIGVNNGGVWKTTDAGRTWVPIFDGQPTGSIGALAVAPSNPDIIYVGSGEGLRRPDLSTGDGIYKSTDAGHTWRHLGLRDGQQITNVIVDPQDPNRVFVAVLGHPYGPNSERGVFRSTDGGETWQKIFYKDDDTGATDLAFDPKNPQTLYADMWSSRRPPWTTGNPLEGHTGGLFKSSDGGDTWHPLAKGLPTNAQGLGRIGFGISPSNPNRMYALVDAAPEVGGLYRSDDAGESWQRVNHEERIWGRGSDFAWVRVAPDNPDTIYICNTSTYRSSDAGTSFTAIKGAPGGDDYHTVWINPENPRIILLASDQGATITVNGGDTWSSWYNQPSAQFYHVITDNQFPYWVYGGQQESGSAGTASRSDWGEITFRDWHPVGTEEYGYVAPDPLHPNLIYGGKATRFDMITGQTQDVSPVILRTGKYRFNRTAPLIFSPAAPHTLYLGSNVLFKTTDAGHSWQIISPDLTREDPGVPPNIGDMIASDPAQGKHRGVIYSLAPSSLDANLIWAGTDDGLVWLTRDGGQNWREVSPPGLTAWSKIAQLDASHFDPNGVYAAVNRFRLDDLHPYIYRTHDGGQTWEKITNGLPDDASVNVVREDPVRQGLLFAGTERAIYVSFNDGDSWQSLQLNLPATSMRDLVVHGDDIVVGTHGRSFWILDDITALREVTSEAAAASAFLFRPGITYRVRRNVNTDTPLPPEEPAGKNPPDGAIFDYNLQSAASGPVKLQILDANGRIVRAFSSADKPEATMEQLGKELNVPLYWIRPPQILSDAAGAHRFVWDLRIPPPASLRHEYPISAIVHDTPRLPVGPAVMPGMYSVRLDVAGQTYTQPLEIKMDPRIIAPVDQLDQQFRLASRICEAMNASFASLGQVRAVRAQLRDLEHQAPKGEVADAIRALEEKVAPFEGAVPGFGQAAHQDSFAQLNGQFGQLLAVVDGADAAPTQTAQDTTGDLQRALTGLENQWDDVKARDIPALDDQLRRANLPIINLTATLEPEQETAGDDEP